MEEFSNGFVLQYQPGRAGKSYLQQRAEVPWNAFRPRRCATEETTQSRKLLCLAAYALQPGQKEACVLYVFVKFASQKPETAQTYKRNGINAQR